MAAQRASAMVLLASVFVIAICGLVYELIAGTLSSYLLGSSVTHFSLVIGLFLSAMGLGSFLSRYIRRALLSTFLLVEILIGLFGGASALLLFFAFARLGSYLPLLVALCAVIGALVGLEIPLLIRILKSQTSLRVAVGNVLTVDYIGALAASLLFPLLLVPHLGLIRTGFLFGLLNAGVAGFGLWLFRQQLPRRALLTVLAGGVAAVLLVGLVTAGSATSWLEDRLYDDEIIFAKTTQHQRVVLTRWRGDLRLFLDGNIQFSTVDEFRYHEALVHPALSLLAAPGRGLSVLVLGGGDGMAAREVLKYERVSRVDVVDLDPAITELFTRQPLLAAHNRHALSNRRVRVINQDAQKFLERSTSAYDAIIADLPDPNNESLGKLYSRSFYRLIAKQLSPTGVFVTQATSPFYATEAFWCIVSTLEATRVSSAGGTLFVQPYHAQVPSFGDWGFVLASQLPIVHSRMKLRVPTRFLSERLLPTLFVFPTDLARGTRVVNRLDNQVLTRLYQQGYARFNR